MVDPSLVVPESILSCRYCNLGVLSLDVYFCIEFSSLLELNNILMVSNASPGALPSRKMPLRGTTQNIPLEASKIYTLESGRSPVNNTIQNLNKRRYTTSSSICPFTFIIFTGSKAKQCNYTFLLLF